MTDYYDDLNLSSKGGYIPPPEKPSNKYQKLIKGKAVDCTPTNCYVDVYDVLKAFDVTCPAMQHAIKKMLCSGTRGYKNAEKDKLEAIASIERSIELEK